MTTITDAQWQAVAKAMDSGGHTSTRERLVAGLDKLRSALVEDDGADCDCISNIHCCPTRAI